MINMIIHDALKLGKELYVVTLNFKDMFDSIHHELLEYTLKKIGCNEKIMNVINSSYEDSRTIITTAKKWQRKS
jgi:hypothetical protein